MFTAVINRGRKQQHLWQVAPSASWPCAQYCLICVRSPQFTEQISVWLIPYCATSHTPWKQHMWQSHLGGLNSKARDLLTSFYHTKRKRPLQSQAIRTQTQAAFCDVVSVMTCANIASSLSGTCQNQTEEDFIMRSNTLCWQNVMCRGSVVCDFTCTCSSLLRRLQNIHKYTGREHSLLKMVIYRMYWIVWTKACSQQC